MQYVLCMLLYGCFKPNYGIPGSTVMNWSMCGGLWRVWRRVQWTVMSLLVLSQGVGLLGAGFPGLIKSQRWKSAVVWLNSCCLVCHGLQYHWSLSLTDRQTDQSLSVVICVVPSVWQRGQWLCWFSSVTEWPNGWMGDDIRHEMVGYLMGLGLQWSVLQWGGQATPPE